MSEQDTIQAWLTEHEIDDVEFVDLYCAVKNDECREFQEIVTPWEREVLLLNV